MKDSIKDLLNSVGLKNTPTRSAIVKAFRDRKYALSYSELEALIDPEIDKVTTYRNLKTFEENGIIHQVIDGSTSIKYALCSSSCDDEHHKDEHVHFKCTSCGHTFCLENAEIPDVNLPAGYTVISYALLIQGKCNGC